MAKKIANVAADAAKPASIIGAAKIKGFRYFDSLCFATLSNGVQGCIGSSTEYPFSTMLQLKGMGMELSYEYTGKSKCGKYDQYRLEWSVE